MPSKLSKAELLDLANYLYSRYEAKYQQKLLSKKLGRAIIKMDTNYANTKK